MATRMGAPGVRIELHDRSGYSLVETPNAVGGVVGFAPKGELNKIQLLTNTAEQDTYFGLGFNNSRYNQGMYAARAVINAGGHAEFVRPYGEEIDKTDPRKRDLKTDAYVVAFDYDAVKNEENLENQSIKIEYFASTRYMTDGAARYGATRKINNVAETITYGDNVNFNIAAAEDYNQESNYERNGGVARGKSDIVMFAIMNRDPSAANRAYSTYKCSMKDDSGRATGEIKVTVVGKVGFTIDDIVYGPAAGFTKDLCTFRVTNIVDKDVTLKAEDEATVNALARLGYSPSVLIYSDAVNAVADGYDYLNVKTAVTGRGVKTFGSLHLDSALLERLKGTAVSGNIESGEAIAFLTQSAGEVYVRFETNTYIENATTTAVGDYTVLTTAAHSSVQVGDALQLEKGDGASAKVAMYAVSDITDTVMTLSFVSSSVDQPDTEFGGQQTGLKLKNFANNWVDSENSYVVTVSDKSTLATVVNDLVKILIGAELGYGQVPVIGDIKVDENNRPVVADDDKTITLVDGAAVEFVPGDLVAITRGSMDIVKDANAHDADIETKFAGTNIVYVGTVKESDPILNKVVLSDKLPTSARTALSDTDMKYQMVNLTQTNKTVIAAVDSYEFITADQGLTISTEITSDQWVLVTEGASGVNPVYKLPKGLELMAAMVTGVVTGDKVVITLDNDTNMSTTATVVKVESDDKIKVALTADYQKEGTHPETTDLPPESVTVTGKVHVSANDKSLEYADIYLVGNYDTSVPYAKQLSTDTADLTSIGVPYVKYAYADTHVVDKSDKVLTDSAIGGTFVGLGLARIQYMDVNFTGDTARVYDLTEEGEAVARLYLSVAYMYNGIRYEFDGTVVPYVYNDMQLYIGDTAENELEGSGAMFVLNDSGVMELFREDNVYDLSATVAKVDGTVVPCGSVTCPAFNENDPAIVNDAVWTYDPAQNMSTSTLSNAFNLFLDKDKSDVTFFVGAGLGVNNFGLKGYETLNTQLMQAILSICELRKDCFALFDGVADSRINQTLKLDSPASRFGSTLGRWGAIYDARPIFFDSIVTKTNVEIAPSIAMASLITANRRGSVWWYPPAGEDTGMIPGAWCRKVKYERRFNIPEDTESDIAKLCDIHVNPFRTNKKGIYCYGDFTMQMEDTAFNAINVTMLVAGIHKMYYNYLDSRVFRINTATLRAQITADLQGQLDKIIGENPAGLEPGSYVLCDDTNNPPEVVEAHKLYVDLMLYPTTSTRYIFLRTNVLSRANGNVISTELTTGNRQ